MSTPQMTRPEDPPPKKFFTWTDKTYKEPAKVPLRLRQQIRILWLKGAIPEELAATFKLPLEWVADFALEDHKDDTTH